MLPVSRRVERCRHAFSPETAHICDGPAPATRALRPSRQQAPARRLVAVTERSCLRDSLRDGRAGTCLMDSPPATSREDIVRWTVLETCRARACPEATQRRPSDLAVVVVDGVCSAEEVLQLAVARPRADLAAVGIDRHRRRMLR